MPRLSTPLLGLLALSGVLLTSSVDAAQLQYFQLSKGTAPQAIAPLDDGQLWYATGNGALARFDPKRGEGEQVSLGSGSKPSAVIAGDGGEAWVADRGLNAIVRVDPQRLGAEVVALPPQANDAELDSLAMDDDGALWFTGEHGFYGRLDPHSRQVQVWKTPTGKSADGLAVTPDGQVWFASRDDNSLNEIDPSAGSVTRFEAPTPHSGPQRLAADSIGRLWITQPDSGQLARFDPSDHHWKSWKLPGTQAQPVAIYVDAMDRVWLSDAQSHSLLRFDPQRERFTRLAGDAAATGALQLSGRPGEVWGAETGSDRLLVIRD
ncbi:MAG: Virginiamycin B lyase [Stenotrophomonas maltophilia]|nr:MAG: Virginiamycin B lyase [Stenotrophomonas maltophilia]